MIAYWAGLRARTHRPLTGPGGSRASIEPLAQAVDLREGQWSAPAPVGRYPDQVRGQSVGSPNHPLLQCAQPCKHRGQLARLQRQRAARQTALDGTCQVVTVTNQLRACRVKLVVAVHMPQPESRACIQRAQRDPQQLFGAVVDRAGAAVSRACSFVLMLFIGVFLA